MYSGDADGDGKPDRFIMTYWKSRDYGDNDNPNPWTREHENSPVLDHALSYYYMDTDNYIKADDKYVYAVPPPIACSAQHPEGAFLGRQILPRKPAETFFGRFQFSHSRRQDDSAGDQQDPYAIADLNRDGSLDGSDFQILQNAFGTCIWDGNFNPAADFDGDECVTSIDRETWQDLFVGSTGNHAPRAIVKSIDVAADSSSCTAIISPNDVNDGSFDPDGDALTLALDSTGPFGIGDHIVTLTVTDSHGLSNSFSTIVTVTPLSITNLSADRTQLWPPNHKMMDVTVDYDVVENCGSLPFNCELTVTSNEPVNGKGDGNSSPDWEIIDAHHVRLRAERAGDGDGRIYTISLTCTDSNGISSTRSAQVSVAENQQRK
jgi:hypothetical protein